MVQLKVKDPADLAQYVSRLRKQLVSNYTIRNYLQSPYYFVACRLWDPAEDQAADKGELADTPLVGSLVSSLHRLKDMDNTDGGFFVFGDISVKIEGSFRLKFTLFEILSGHVVSLQSIISEAFTVFSTKNFPGMSESTFISRSFGDQGVRIRIRKENRFVYVLVLISFSDIIIENVLLPETTLTVARMVLVKILLHFNP